MKVQDEKRWKSWCAFCDKAEVAPDTLLSPEELARRYNRNTRGMATPEYVRKLMPENEAEMLKEDR